MSERIAKALVILLFLFVYLVVIEIATMFVDYEFIIAAMLGLIYYELNLKEGIK